MAAQRSEINKGHKVNMGVMDYYDWWFHGFIWMSKLTKLYGLNMDRLLHVIYTSLKLKNMVHIKVWISYFLENPVWQP